MGVNGLLGFIMAACEECCINKFGDQGEEKHTKNYIAIVDAMAILYRYGIAIRKRGSDLRTRNGSSKNHIFAIFNTTVFLVQQGIIPIFVFDGKSNSLKDNMIKHRIDKKTNAEKELHKPNPQLNDTEVSRQDFIKNFRKSYNISHAYVKECMNLLNMLGVPYVQSPGEADQQCSAIAKYITGTLGFENVIIMTEDSDVLVCGGPTIVRKSPNKKNVLLECKLPKILNFLHQKAVDICNLNDKPVPTEFTQENLIDLSVLLGTDYCGRIVNLTTPQVFEKFVLSNFDIYKYVELVHHNPNNPLAQGDYLERINEVRCFYKNSGCTNVQDPANIRTYLSQQDTLGARNLLRNVYNFDSYYVDQKLLLLREKTLEINKKLSLLRETNESEKDNNVNKIHGINHSNNC